MAAWAMRHTNTAVLYDIHTPPVGEKWLQFRLSKSLRAFIVYLEACFTEVVAIRRSDYILWSSLIQKEYYTRRGFRPDRLREVRHGVNVEAFDSGPVPETKPRLLVYAGTMVPYQGADKLVEAFAAMPEGGLRLRMIGFTDKESRLRELAERAGIETVPQITHSQVADSMRDAHCTAIIAHKDNKKYKNGAAPTKWPESLAVGRPILSMDVYDTALMIPQLNVGWVVENSVEGLVSGMTALRDSPTSELQAMGERARQEAIRNYAWSVIGDKFSNIIDEAVRK
jgi:glycosyltransferase involved in cell wall biosynthesis